MSKQDLIISGISQLKGKPFTGITEHDAGPTEGQRPVLQVLGSEGGGGLCKLHDQRSTSSCPSRKDS